MRFTSTLLSMFVIACSSSSSPAAPAPDASTDAGIDAPAEAGDPELINGCTSFADRTDAAASRTIQWDLPPFQGNNPDACIEIKVGQTVTFDGNFGQHPLDTLGGTTPSPIPNYDHTTGEVTFTAPGVYGYVCDNHFQMQGAIKVIP